MSRHADVVVIGVGNRYRGDDGVGPAVAAGCAARALPGVRVVTEVADATDLLEAWSGAALAVIVDAAAGPAPGRVGCCGIHDLPGTAALSSHGLDIAAALRLGQALERLPAELVVVTVGVADTGHGLGLSVKVAEAVPAAVEWVVTRIACRASPVPPTRSR